jgi:hypothetical protein
VVGIIEFNEFQNKASLPDSYHIDGQFGLVFGWGSITYPEETTPQFLQKILMLIIDNSICQSYFRFRILEDQICAFIGKHYGICSVSIGTSQFV